MLKGAYLCELGECFVIGIQNVTPALDNVQRDLISNNPREVVEYILVEQVKQLGSEFNSSWATTTDNERQKTLTLLIGGCR